MKFLFVLSLLILLFPTLVHARITPNDIVNDNREAYQLRIKNYSPQNQKNLESLQQKIVQVNKTRTDQLEAITLVQGEILDEYVFRKGIHEKSEDGVHRDLTDPVEKARYWITFAHEAVAYQAAKIYIPNLNG